MRVPMLAAALFAAACADIEPPAAPADDSDGYTLEIRASDAEQIYLVTAPDGRVVAGRVELNVGGRAVQITAEEGAPGGDRAHVLIRGAPEAEVREFVASADHLSPAVQAQMLAELGLE